MTGHEFRWQLELFIRRRFHLDRKELSSKFKNYKWWASDKISIHSSWNQISMNGRECYTDLVIRLLVISLSGNAVIHRYVGNLVIGSIPPTHAPAYLLIQSFSETALPLFNIFDMYVHEILAQMIETWHAWSTTYFISERMRKISQLLHCHDLQRILAKKVTGDQGDQLGKKLTNSCHALTFEWQKHYAVKTKIDGLIQRLHLEDLIVK